MTAAEKALYKPTPSEAEAIKAFLDAGERRGPRLKVAVTGANSAKILVDHADSTVGSVALMRRAEQPTIQ